MVHLPPSFSYQYELSGFCGLRKKGERGDGEEKERKGARRERGREGERRSYRLQRLSSPYVVIALANTIIDILFFSEKGIFTTLVGTMNFQQNTAVYVNRQLHVSLGYE